MLGENRLYQGLRVAREGRDLFLTDPVLSGALTYSTALSIPYAIDGLVPRLAAAVDGDPATEPEPEPAEEAARPAERQARVADRRAVGPVSSRRPHRTWVAAVTMTT